MKFYRVKPEFDNCKLSKSYEILVNRELFTEKEWKRALVKWSNRNNMRRDVIVAITPGIKRAFSAMFDIVEIPKNKTYWFFGARFAVKEV